jgi:hypothetical protein
MPPDMTTVQFGLPTPARWHVILIVTLLVAYVTELVLNLLGVPLYALLPWYPLGSGFEPWQLATHFLVQGNDAPNVLWVVVGLLVLYFFLPSVDTVVERRQLGFAVLSAAIGSVLLGLAFDGAGLAGAMFPTLGWGKLVGALFVLYGLARPDQVILLVMFPLRGRWLVWGTLGFALLLVLARHDLDAYGGLGVWCGVYGWWHTLGPGARRRRLMKKAAGIEKELKIRVIEGGKSKPQGRQGDDWVH